MATSIAVALCAMAVRTVVTVAIRDVAVTVVDVMLITASTTKTIVADHTTVREVLLLSME